MTAASAPLAVGDTAPEFTLKDQNEIATVSKNLNYHIFF
jgi:hypothetical protein